MWELPQRARKNPRPKEESESWAAGSLRMRKHPLKFFWFSLFTTDAASESNANAVCKLPSGEEENERSEVKKNSTLQIRRK